MDGSRAPGGLHPASEELVDALGTVPGVAHEFDVRLIARIQRDFKRKPGAEREHRRSREDEANQDAGNEVHHAAVLMRRAWRFAHSHHAAAHSPRFTHFMATR